MHLVSLTYVSRNNIDQTEIPMLRQVMQILASAQAANKSAGVTGALIFDANWFVQILEGDLWAVWKTFERVARDRRHRDLIFVEMKGIRARRFGNWWMGSCERTAGNANVFEPYLNDGQFQPDVMGGDMILSLMVDIARIGHDRQLASGAA